MLRNLPYVSWYAGVIVVNLVLVALVLVFMGQFLPPEVPLYYGRPQGSEQIAAQSALVIPPLLAGGIAVAGLAISKFVPDSFTQKILLGTGIVATLLSTITVLRIILLVGSFA